MHAESTLQHVVEDTFAKPYQIKALPHDAPPGTPSARLSALVPVAAFSDISEARDYLREHSEGAEMQGFHLFLTYPPEQYESAAHVAHAYDWRGDLAPLGTYLTEAGDVVEG